MTLKDWNNLSHSQRTRIVNIFYHNMSEDFKKDISMPFHHNFNWDKEDGTYQEGRWYQLMLRFCTIQKDGRIRIIVTI